MASASTVTSSCKICFENFSTESDKRACTIPCGHISHELCLRRWFQEQIATSGTARCPECRRVTRLDQIIRLFGSPICVPTSRPGNKTPSRADVRREICERSRLLNRNPPNPPSEEISTSPRLLHRLFVLCMCEGNENFRKVYLSLMIKLILTLGLLMLMTFHDESKKLICEHYAVIIFAICFVCGVICSIVIPSNSETALPVGGGSILYMSAFAICNLWSMDPCVTSMYSFKTLILGIVSATFIVIILTKVALKIRWDLTRKREELFWSLLLLILIIIVCSIVWYFFGRNSVAWFFLQSLCLFVCCLYLIMFTQLMKGNTYASATQYISLAIGLYASIVNMFIFILRVFGEANIF